MEWQKVFMNAIHYWQRNKIDDLKAKIADQENESEENRKNYWYKLGDRSENDKNEMLEVITAFLHKSTKETESQVFKANRNKA